VKKKGKKMETNKKQCESAVAVKLSDDAMKQMVGGLTYASLVGSSSLSNALKLTSFKSIAGIYVHL
jgi:hypothetical protein